MKIAIVGSNGLPIPAVRGGAVQVLVEELIKGNERKKKFDIDLYTVTDELLNKINYEKCNIIQIPQEEIDLYKNYGNDMTVPYGFAINERLKKVHYDYVVIEHNLRVYNSIDYAERKAYHIHNCLDSIDKPDNIINKMISSADNVLCVSKFLQNQLNQIQKSSKNKVLYNCIDFEIFNPQNTNKEYIEDFKEKNNIKKDDFCFIYTGRILPEKGVLELVKAFKVLKKKYQKIKLIIVGNPNFKKNVKTEYINSLEEEIKDIRESVIFTGFVNHNSIPTILSIANVVVIPSLCEEAFGIVALEAMAMKKATISTISGGLTEPLDKSCALFIDKNKNVEYNLYCAMNKLYNNREQTMIMGECGYKRVHSISDFDSKNYFENFCKILGL